MNDEENTLTIMFQQMTYCETIHKSLHIQKRPTCVSRPIMRRFKIAYSVNILNVDNLIYKCKHFISHCYDCVFN